MGSKLLGVVLSLWACCGVGQEARPRLAGLPMGVNRAVLVGSRTPHALRGEDVGAVAPETAIPGITLVFKRTAGQEEALLALLAAQQDTASPLYHRWLTPDTFATRFGMAAADVAAAESWLRAQGFEVEGVARGRDRITFSGSAAQVQAAFGAELRHYQVEGERHFAPAADLTLPVELASVTAAVLHLSDFRPKPRVAAVSRVTAEYTTLATQTHYLSPFDLLTMYSITLPVSGEQSLGFGQSLAVVGQSFVDVGSGSAVSRFRQQVRALGQISTVLIPGSGVEAISPGDEGESEIDLEYSTGIAGEASAFLVYVGANGNYNVFDALSYAITEDIAPVVSISYGECESLLSAAELDQGNALFAQAAAQGQTLVASSGDSGSTACARYSTSPGVTVAQQQALAVDFPANSPYVTAVGGTQMAAGTSSAGASLYWSAATGVDTVGSLLSYVPEVAWNEGSATRGIVAGGGGSSAYYPRPAWQTGVQGISAGLYRLLPDVALQASIQSPGYLVCTDDLGLLRGQSAQSSCGFLFGSSGGQYTVAGGTSFAAPVFAGMVTILNQAENATGQGNLNPVLYGLASNPNTYATVFHDITSGTIACAAGEGSCAAPGESGFAATPGYDEATGLGSIDFGKLLAAWPANSLVSLEGTNLLLGTPLTAAPGDSLKLYITLGNLGSMNTLTAATGTLSVSVDGVIVQPALALTSANSAFAMASYPFVSPSSTGSHVVLVKYSGDATHAPSVATASFLVGNVVPSGSFSLAAGNLTIANGGTGTDVVTVTPGGGYSGRVVWALSVASSTNAALTACYSIHSPAVNGTSTATLKMGVGSACGAAAAAKEGQMLRLGASLNNKGGGVGRVPWREPLTAALAGLLVCGSLVVRRRGVAVPRLLAVLVVAVASLHLSGCGGAKSTSEGTVPSPPPPVATATNYTLTLKAPDSVNGTIAASTTFTLTVD